MTTQRTAEFPKFRDPATVFEAAIKAGKLSSDENAPNYAGNYMYMGDAENGGAMFKDIVTRAYLPAMGV